jgi:rhamnulose-1-phosphate aldolase/alcohol dehydrogenase
MKSRWDDASAREAVDRWGGSHGEAVALRVYTSRLIGAEPDLVLHGGGNTSVKGKRTTILGDSIDCLWVKGSGSSLDAVEPKDFPALDLGYLRRLRALDRLDDAEMVNQLRSHLFDASAPNPSVEALLHAFLPHAFVDHSHADAVVALTNQPGGAEKIGALLGDKVAVLPYIMPGFPLAKAVADAFEKKPDIVAIVLAKHGLFTFGDTAKESYERHVAAVDECERHARDKRRPSSVQVSALGSDEIARRVARAAPILRGLVAEATGDADEPWRRVVVEHRASEEVLAFTESDRASVLAQAGPLTPDHVIRTKARAMYLGVLSWDDEAKLRIELESAVRLFRASYDRSFDECASARGVRPKKLDAGPRVALLPGAGALAFGRTKKDAIIAADITEHTVKIKRLADAMDGYEALDDLDLFDLEYWSLEQAKLGKAKPKPLEGQVALVTGGAGAIGRGIGEACAAAGANVVVVDVDHQRAREAALALEAVGGRGTAIGVQADVSDEASMRRAFDEACVAFGGVDLVVPNAGVAMVRAIDEHSAADARRVSEVNYVGVLNTIREASRVMKAQGTGGSIVVNASKNVFAPGKDFAAYSASKAAAHQLAKVAALELAPMGVRVNQINADAVFAHGETRSGLWDKVGPARAKSRGLAMDELEAFYRERNLLKARVEARHVGDAVVFFATKAVVTTGATMPVDGGVAEAFPR